MSAAQLPPDWLVWIAALSQPLHARLDWRLASLIPGLLFASGRRTVSSWLRAAGIGSDFRSYYYFLDSLSRKAPLVAAVLLRLALPRLPLGDRLVFALDDTPTKRYGRKVQGAGLHHNPTPGPAGSALLYGHNWVVLSLLVRHPAFSLIGLPLLGWLYVRQKDVSRLPAKAAVTFRTKLDLAAEAIVWLRRHLHRLSPPVWLAVDGFYAKRQVLRPPQAEGIIVVGRLRKDAALLDLPQPLKPGAKRGRGRPPVYGKNRLSLAKRAGQQRGWITMAVRTTTGAAVEKRIKTFLATWRPAGGTIRVVLVKEEDDSWRALFCSDIQAEASIIVQTAMDRWGIEQNFKDLKEVEAIAEVQLRRYHANVGAFNLNLWVHSLIELWSWTKAAAELSDRSASPWDVQKRRPSHADRRKALQREVLEKEFLSLGLAASVGKKIRSLLAGWIRLAA